MMNKHQASFFVGALVVFSLVLANFAYGAEYVWNKPLTGTFNYTWTFFPAWSTNDFDSLLSRLKFARPPESA